MSVFTKKTTAEMRDDKNCFRKPVGSHLEIKWISIAYIKRTRQPDHITKWYRKQPEMYKNDHAVERSGFQYRDYGFI